MVTPVSQITDYSRTVTFCIDWLGFGIDWKDGPTVDGGRYLQVSRGSVVLHLTNTPTRAAPAPGPSRNSRA